MVMNIFTSSLETKPNEMACLSHWVSAKIALQVRSF